jgi:hypothetical protein
MSESGQPCSELSDVDILTSGVDAPERGQRTCMFRNQGHVHGILPILLGDTP